MPVDLVGDTQPVLSRPLKLIDDTAYLVTWTQGKVKHKERTVRAIVPVLLASNGLCWEDTTDPDDLPVILDCDHNPPQEKVLSLDSVRMWQDGYRPSVTSVYARVRDLVDHFVDFTGCPLGNQSSLTELTACYIMSTWFSDVCTSNGYLWAYGEKGSGKSHLLGIISELAYLGLTVLSGSTFASTRDLAHYGSCLCCDDMDEYANRKRVDPDKLNTILGGLSGNPRITVKEMGPDRRYHTRYVNVRSPRMFNSTRIPDRTLSSRCVLVTMIKSMDQEKGLREPSDILYWPHSHRELIDDLWLVGLHHQDEFQAYYRSAGDGAKLLGRDLQVWLAVFGTAKWLDANGGKGVWRRVHKLSLEYQKEKGELVSWDIDLLVQQALVDHYGKFEKSDRYKKRFFAVDLVDWVKELAEGRDIDPAPYNKYNIGCSLGRLGIRRQRKLGEKHPAWLITELDHTRFKTAMERLEVSQLGKGPLKFVSFDPATFVENGNGYD